MSTGVEAGHTITRMHRLEGAYSKHELHHELKVAIRELLDLAEEDLKDLCTATEDETAIIHVLSDQYRMSELIMERAAEFKMFFAEYRKQVRYLQHHQHPLSDEMSQRCVHIVYKLAMCKLESEPEIEDTIYWAWRGILELPHS